MRSVLLPSILVIIYANAQPFLAQNPAIPANLQITTFATGLNFPYGLCQLPDGSLLVATSNPTTTVLFASTLQVKRLTATANGAANPPTTVFEGGAGPATGMACAGEIVAVATGTNSASQILILRAGEGGVLSQLDRIGFTYPPGYWQHDSRTVALRAMPGQSGFYQLLFGVGSAYNNAATAPGVVQATGLLAQTLAPESLYSVQFSVVGSAVAASPAVQLARGLRNAFSLAFSASGDIHLADNGQNDPVTDAATSADYFATIPAGAAGPALDFGFPNTYPDANTGAMVGPLAGISQPLAPFVPIGGVRRQGASGLALAPPGFPTSLRNGAFIGFYGSSDGRSMNPVVYVDRATGQYFDFIPGGQTGASRLLSMLSTDSALYVADLTRTGSYFDPGAGVIYKIAEGSAVPEPPAGPVADDRTTQGSWPGKYGADGYFIAGGPSNPPSYASVTVGSVFTWAGQTSDARALQVGGNSVNRIAATYVPANYMNHFDVRVSLNDGATHRVALYLLDWDTTIRSQTITVTDVNTQQVLDAKTISSFTGGVYAVWNLRGTVNIRVEGVAGSPVLSGIFFDPAAPSSPSFALSASPASAAPGTSGSSTVTVIPANGFASAVTLAAAASGWPSGITGTIVANTVTIAVASSVAPGSYLLTVNGTSGSLSAFTAIALTVTPPPSFTLSATPVSAAPGTSGSSTVTVIPANGFASAVTLAVAESGWPSGITGTIVANTVTIAVASSVAPGAYSLTVNGTSGSLSASTAIALTVTPPPSFTLSATPASAGPGSSGSSTVTVIPANGFASAVTLAVAESGWPSGITGTIVANTVTITVASSVAPGAYSLTVNATSGSLSASTTIALTVTPPPSFTLSATPVSAAPGTSGSSTVTVIPANGFASAVTLAASAWPAGIGGTFAGNTVTIAVASSVAPGAYSLTVNATSGSLSASTTIALTVSTGPILGSSAVFTSQDAVTKGSWNGTYGADGYVAANFPPNLPGYAGVSSNGAGTYTWAQLSTDIRAPRLPSGAATGFASCYYSTVSSSFSFRLNLADSAAHQVAIYLLDWDTTQRAQTIAILDAATETVLDARTFSNFHDGLWAVWNVKGNVIVKVTAIGPVNAVVSGVFLGPVSGPGFGLGASPASATAGSTGASTVTVTPSGGFDGPVTLSNPGWPAGITGTFVTNPATVSSGVSISVGSGVAPGVYALPVNGVSGTLAASASIALTVNPPSSFTLSASAASASAGSAGSSTVTVIPSGGFSGPVTLSNPGWPAGITGTFTTNPAASSSNASISVGSAVAPGVYLLPVNGSSGALAASVNIAFTVNPAASFTLSAVAASVAVGSAGASTVTIVPAGGFSGPVTLSNPGWPAGITGTFATNPATVSSGVSLSVGSGVAPGPYLLPVHGSSGGLAATANIALTVTPAVPAGSGAFATFTGLDTATRGAWIGKYGDAGYTIANGGSRAPGFASVAIPGAFTFTWAGQTIDPRALQLYAGLPIGIASAYTQYTNATVSVNVTVADAGVHQVALYLLDWDTSSRSQTVTILDAATLAELDTRTIGNFHEGVYGVWNFRGNIVIRLTPAVGTSPVFSGVFFNP